LGDDKEDDPLEKYNFWRSFKAQVRILRDDMSSGKAMDAASGTQQAVSAAYEGIMPLLDAMKRAQGRPQPQEPANEFPTTLCGGVDIYDMQMRTGSFIGHGNNFGFFRAPGAESKVADARGVVAGLPHPTL
jgi:hypothetical protein